MGSRAKSLKKKIIINILVMSIVPLIIITITCYIIVQKVVYKDFNLLNKLILSKSEQIVELKAEEVNGIINYLSQSPYIAQINEELEAKEILIKILSSYVNSNESIQNIYFISAEGDVVASDKFKIYGDIDYREMNSYKTAIRNEVEAVPGEIFYDEITRSYLYSYSKVIKNDDKLIGVMVVEIPIKYITKFINYKEYGSNIGEKVIINKNGEVIYHDDKDIIGNNSNNCEWIDEIIKNQKNKNILLTKGDVKYNAYININKSTGLIYVIMFRESIVSEIMLRIMIAPIVVFTIISIIIIFATLKISKKILEPTESFKKILVEMREGDFSNDINWNEVELREFREISNCISELNNNMNIVLTNAKNTVDIVKENSEKIAKISGETGEYGERVKNSINLVTKGKAEQSSYIEESKLYYKQLTMDIENARNLASKMEERASEVLKKVDNGLYMMENVRKDYENSIKVSEIVVERIQSLVESSKNIISITDKIKEISAQTNLLAINASIEATRSGDTTEGFRVISQEIKVLSEQSSIYTLEIDYTISNIQESIKRVIEKNFELIEIVKKFGYKVEITDNSYKYIAEKTSKLNNDIEKVVDSLQSMNITKENLTRKLNLVDKISIKSDILTRDSKEICITQKGKLESLEGYTKKLLKQIEALNELVNRFITK